MDRATVSRWLEGAVQGFVMALDRGDWDGQYGAEFWLASAFAWATELERMEGRTGA